MDAIVKKGRPANKGRKAINPVVTEIVRNGLVAATEEMKTNLMRTAYNMIIYEALRDLLRRKAHEDVADAFAGSVTCH